MVIESCDSQIESFVATRGLGRVLAETTVFPSVFLAALCMSGELLIGGLDLILPPAMTMEPFYGILIIGSVVFGGPRFGLAALVVAVGLFITALAYPAPVLVDPSPQTVTALRIFSTAADFAILFGLVNWGSQAFIRERSLSRTDSLTGIANRLGFHRRLEHEMLRHNRAVRPMTLAYIDCDDFKAVNDRWGHDEGDRVLLAVASALRTTLRKTDSCARLGGDEFAVLLPETSEAQASLVLDKLVNILNGAMVAGRWPVGFSVGAVVFTACPTDSSQALDLADRIMYSVKKSGKARTVITCISAAENIASRRHRDR